MNGNILAGGHMSCSPNPGQFWMREFLLYCFIGRRGARHEEALFRKWIAFALGQAAPGTPVVDIMLKMGIREATFFSRKEKRWIRRKAGLLWSPSLGQFRLAVQKRLLYLENIARSLVKVIVEN